MIINNNGLNNEFRNIHDICEPGSPKKKKKTYKYIWLFTLYTLDVIN